MRKPDPDRQEWFDERQHRSKLRLARSAGMAKNSRQRSALASTGRPRIVVIAVPSQISADRDEDRKPLLRVLTSVLSALAMPGTKVKLDFSRTVRMFPGGMLLLLAYLELLIEEKPGRIVAKCAPGTLIGQLLRHFGIADKLGIPAAGSAPRAESVVTWKYLTGAVADGAKIAELINSYRSLTAADIPEGLYDVLTEALTNVRHHAYPGTASVPEPLRRWWLFARYVEPRGATPGNLFIGVYDVGVGIQNSLRARLSAGEKALEFGTWIEEQLGVEVGTGKALDRKLLETAIEGARSSTGLAFRGNGLPEMRDFVRSTKSGKLLILSGGSQYVCLAESGRSATYTCSEPILGTLIVWSMPLQPKGV